MKNQQAELAGWLKHVFWRESKAKWTETEWAATYSSPFAAHQDGIISTGKLCEILAAELIEGNWIRRVDE